jgi:hypothetical protein
VEDGREVVLDGLQADVESSSDLPVADTIRNEAEDFQLALRERNGEFFILEDRRANAVHDSTNQSGRADTSALMGSSPSATRRIVETSSTGLASSAT